ncbi:MAG: phage terminase small subunit [Methylobacter sp.]
MSTNPLDQIKAQQIAEAKNSGDLHPYQFDTGDKPVQKPAISDHGALFNPLDQIKKAQLAESEQAGNQHPHLGSDSAFGPDRTVIRTRSAVGKLEHYQAAMSADLAKLSGINDLVEKAKAKAMMMATYLPFVTDYISKGDNYPNDIAVRVCIWLFDILDIERALNLAFVLIKQSQVTPPKFDRDLPTFVCDAMYDYANVLLKLDQSASPYLDAVVATMDNDRWSLSPPVQSKMYALLAKHKQREGNWSMCLALCDKAEQINPEGAGVKTMKKAALAALEKLKPVSEPSEKTEEANPESAGDKDAKDEAQDTEQQNSESSE